MFGRYLVEKKLGEGGMGSVWLVRHLELDAHRALKLIVSSHSFDPEAQARFRREARVMAKLSHPNAVVVHDARIAPDVAFIEMEYVRGESLNRLLKPGVPMPLDRTARILVQLCDVLQEAHEQGIVHRDLKPSNLMLLGGRPPGQEFLKVLDFGIAKVLEPGQEAVDVHTQTGSFMGTAQYSSPEQAVGLAALDGRSDLYSVGVLLYEFLTGRRPFDGPTVIHQLHDHMHRPPPPFAARNPTAVVPRGVEQVVLRALAKNPDDRPQTAHELAEQFLRAVDQAPQTDQPAVSEPSSPGSVSPYWPYVPVEQTPSQASQTEDPYRVTYQSEAASVAETLLPGMPSQLAPSPPPIAPLDEPGLQKKAPKVRSRSKVTALALAVVALIAVSLLFASGHARQVGQRLGLVGKTRPALPPGFAAVEADDLVHGWPRVIVRTIDGVSFRFVRIEGATFVMGDARRDLPENGQLILAEEVEGHLVQGIHLDDFYLQETEVTNGQMEAYFQAKGIAKEKCPKRWVAAYQAIKQANRRMETYPAVGISHALAAEFAQWIGGKLLTEAQWEYAARSRGKAYPYPWGTDGHDLKKKANIDSMGALGDINTVPVGQFMTDQTEQGIFDLFGNVSEWCRGHSPYPIRGGSFATWADQIKTTRARKADPEDTTELTYRQLAEDQTADDLGFRVVIEWPPPPVGFRQYNGEENGRP